MNSWFVEQVKKSDVEYMDIAKTSVISGVKLDDLFNRVQGTIVINHADEIDSIVELANSHQIGLLPVYSKSDFKPKMTLVSKNEIYFLDLTKLKNIEYTKEGIVTIEAGVTQSELFDFLKSNDIKKIMPTTWIDHGGSIINEVACNRKGIAKSDYNNHVHGISATSGDGSKLEIINPDLSDGNNLLFNSVILNSNLAVIKSVSFELQDECRSSKIVELGFKQKHLLNTLAHLAMVKRESGALCGTIILNENAINNLVHKDIYSKKRKVGEMSEWTAFSFLAGTRLSVNATIQDIERPSLKYKMLVHSYLSINLIGKISRLLTSKIFSKAKSVADFRLKLKSGMKGYTNCFKIQTNYGQEKIETISFHQIIRNEDVYLSDALRSIDDFQVKHKLKPMVIIHSLGHGNGLRFDVAIDVDNNAEDCEEKRYAIKSLIEEMRYFDLSEVITRMEEASSSSIISKCKTAFDKRGVIKVMQEEFFFRKDEDDVPSWFSGNTSESKDKEPIENLEQV